MLINYHKYMYVQSMYKVIYIWCGSILQVHIALCVKLLQKVDETVQMYICKCTFQYYLAYHRNQ